MPDMLGICMELEGKRLSQYASFNFNSMCTFAGKHLGANENGIFQLDSGNYDYSAADAYEEIEAFIEFPTSDWAIENQKRVRSAHVGIETDGQMLLTLTDDEGRDHQYLIEPNHVANAQHGAKVNAGRNNGKGRYWRVRVDNVQGSDFSLNTIRIFPVILGTRPAKS